MKTFNPSLRTLSTLVLCLFFIAVSTTVFAQENDRKAKVTIKKSDNGNETEIKEEINIDDAKDLELLLKKYGIDTELEELKDDEVLEITIQRKKDDNSIKDIVIEVDPHNFDFDFDFDINEEHGETETVAFLGVVGESMCTNGEMKPGSKITKVVEGSKAAEYGLQEGDVITKFGDKEIKGFGSLRDAIQSHEPGDKVKIEFTRDGKTQNKTIELGSTERQFKRHIRHFNWQPNMFHNFSSNGKAFLGVTYNDDNDSELEKGVKIKTVVDNSTAEKMGLEDGDIILKINNEATNSWDDLVNAIQKVDVDEEVSISYIRNGETKTATGKMQSRNYCKEMSPEKKEEMEKRCKEMKERMQFKMEKFHEKLDQGLFELEFLGPELENLGEELKQLGPEMEELIKKIKISVELLPISDEELESAGMERSEVNSLDVERFNFYPNPNSGIFSIELTMEEEANTTLRIIDLQGAEVFSEVLSNFSGEYQREINLSDQAKGTYFVQISRENKTTTKKLVIQ